MIICVVGPSCAGKTTIAEYINDKSGVNYFEASDFVKSRYNSESPEENLLKFVQTLFDREGKGVVARDLLSETQISPNESIVIAGFRTVEEVNLLQSKFDDVHCFGVYANSEIRFNRNLYRDGEDAIKNYEDFLNKDFIEYSFGISPLLHDKAKTLILNEGGFDELYAKVDRQIISPHISD